MKTIYRSLSWMALAALIFGASGSLLAQQTLTVSPTPLNFSAQSGSTAAQSQTLSVTSSGPNGAAVNYVASATTTSGSNWLSVTPTSGATPATLTVTVNPTGVVAGSYAGGITVAIAGVVQTVPVSLTVGQFGGSPTSVAFTYLIGGSVPTSQVVQISSPSSVNFTTAVSTATGGNWLAVAPTTGTAPGFVSISLNSAVVTSLAQGTYSGTVTVTPTSGLATPLSIPVTLSVSPTPQLTLSPAAVSFNYQIAGTNNQIQQPVTLSSSGAPLNFGVTASTSSGGNWLVVTPTSGVTPATLTVGVQPGSLPAGTYLGTIGVLAPGASNPSQTITVTLTVSVNPLLSLTPNALTYTYQIGTPTPAAQSITPVSTSTALNYIVTATTNKGGNWITIATPAGTTPSPISISVNPAGLAADTYTGTVTVTGAGAGNPPQNVPVTLKITNDALITANGTTNPSAVTFNFQLGQVAPGAQVINIASTTGSQLNFTATTLTSTGGNWLSIIPSGSTTPGTITAFVVSAGVVAGTYDGSITVTATNPATGLPVPNSPLIIPVKYYISASALLNVSQSSLTLNSTNGAVTPQTLSVTSTGEQLTFNVSFTTASGGPWLTLGPASGPTPNIINVSAVPGSLAPGSYAGTITITAANPNGAAVANSPITIPVTLSVTAGSLQVPTTELKFSQPQGGSAAAQTVTVQSSAAALSFSASATTDAGGNWLTVTPATGTTPQALSISVSAASVPPGTYTGRVTIVSPGASNSPQTIPVSLTVGPAQTITVTPATMTFNHQIGSPAPAAQQISIGSTGGGLNFTIAAATKDGGNWLKVSGANGQTSGIAGTALSVSVDPTGLAAGAYTGTVSVASTTANNSPQVMNVTLNVAALPLPAIAAIGNAASYAPGAVAPGEIIYFGGSNMGVTTLTTSKLNAAGKMDTTLAETQVLFDGIAAPLVYVSDKQVSAIVPYEMAGRVRTRMQVSYKGQISTAVDLNVTDAAPGIFTLNASGTGPGAILNQNGTVNSSSNPAAKESIVVIYATGEGQTNPFGDNGRITPTNGSGLAKPLLPVRVFFGDKEGEVVYSGSAPGLVAGALQVNVRVPAEAATGANVPVVLRVGTTNSQSNVTLAIQ